MSIKVPTPWGCAGCNCITTYRSIVFRTLVGVVNDETKPATVGYEVDAKVSTYGWCGQLSCLVKIGERAKSGDFKNEIVFD